MKKILLFIYALTVISAGAAFAQADDRGARSTMHENTFSNKITVSELYPNPAIDEVHVNYNFLSTVREAKITLYNMLGANVLEAELPRNEKTATINTGKLPSGVYFYSLVVDGKKEFTKRLIIKR